MEQTSIVVTICVTFRKPMEIIFGMGDDLEKWEQRFSTLKNGLVNSDEKSDLEALQHAVHTAKICGGSLGSITYGATNEKNEPVLKFAFRFGNADTANKFLSEYKNF